MDISSNSTPPAATDVFPPDSLRTVRDSLLLVPRLLDSGNFRASLHVASNGQGDRYHLLRLTPAVPTGRNAEELFHYIGKLNEFELSVIECLLKGYDDCRIPSGTQRLRQLQPTFKSDAIFWATGKAVAHYAAALAGFNMRDYRLHRRRSSFPSAQPVPPILVDISDPSLTVGNQERLGFLHDVCRHAPSDPLTAVVRAFSALQFQALVSRRQLLDVLGHSYAERVAALRMFGTCRPLTKAEQRVIVRRRKVQRILDAVEKCQASLKAEMQRKGVWHEDR